MADLPIAEFLKIRILHDLAASEFLDLHLIVLFAVVPVRRRNNTTLYGQDTSENGKRELHSR